MRMLLVALETVSLALSRKATWCAVHGARNASDGSGDGAGHGRGRAPNEATRFTRTAPTRSLARVRAGSAPMGSAIRPE